jgi:hypothetical protein
MRFVAFVVIAKSAQSLSSLYLTSTSPTRTNPISHYQPRFDLDDIRDHSYLGIAFFLHEVGVISSLGGIRTHLLRLE